MVLGLAIPDLGQSFVFLEFIHSSQQPATIVVPSSSSGGNTSDDWTDAPVSEETDSLSIHSVSLFDDLEEWSSTDEDYQLIMNLMKDEDPGQK